jgi:hypothetical protein
MQMKEREKKSKTFTMSWPLSNHLFVQPFDFECSVGNGWMVAGCGSVQPRTRLEKGLVLMMEHTKQTDEFTEKKEVLTADKVCGPYVCVFID